MDYKTVHEVCIWGADLFSVNTCKQLQELGIKVICFIDNDPYMVGQKINNIPVVSPYINNSVIQHIPIIICNQYSEQIYNQLYHLSPFKIFIHENFCKNLIKPSYAPFIRKNMLITDADFENNKKIILNNFNLLHDQHSKKTYISALKTRFSDDYRYCNRALYPKYKNKFCIAKPNEIVINVGGYNGLTTKTFARLMQHQGKIFVFEPLPQSRIRIKKSLREYKIPTQLVELIPAALWSYEGSLTFYSEPDCDPGAFVESAKMKEKSALNKYELPCVSLDKFIETNKIPKIDLIKMDIEGAEEQALEGASNLIQSQTPKLQIAIYHKASDLWKIQNRIFRLNKNYTFFMGHHSFSWRELILYAVNKNQI